MIYFIFFMTTFFTMSELFSVEQGIWCLPIVEESDGVSRVVGREYIATPDELQKAYSDEGQYEIYTNALKKLKLNKSDSQGISALTTLAAENHFPSITFLYEHYETIIKDKTSCKKKKNKAIAKRNELYPKILKAKSEEYPPAEYLLGKILYSQEDIISKSEGWNLINFAVNPRIIAEDMDSSFKERLKYYHLPAVKLLTTEYLKKTPPIGIEWQVFEDFLKNAYMAKERDKKRYLDKQKYNGKDEVED